MCLVMYVPFMSTAIVSSLYKAGARSCKAHATRTISWGSTQVTSSLRKRLIDEAGSMTGWTIHISSTWIGNGSWMPGTGNREIMCNLIWWLEYRWKGTLQNIPHTLCTYISGEISSVLRITGDVNAWTNIVILWFLSTHLTGWMNFICIWAWMKAQNVEHSPKPNCKVRLVMVDGDWRVAVNANRNIQPNEELFYDYRWVPSSSFQQHYSYEVNWPNLIFFVSYISMSTLPYKVRPRCAPGLGWLNNIEVITSTTRT